MAQWREFSPPTNVDHSGFQLGVIMWVKFVVGSHPCSEGSSLGTPFFLPPQQPTFLNSNSIWNLRATGNPVVKGLSVTLVKQCQFIYYTPTCILAVKPKVLYNVPSTPPSPVDRLAVSALPELFLLKSKCLIFTFLLLFVLLTLTLGRVILVTGHQELRFAAAEGRIVTDVNTLHLKSKHRSTKAGFRCHSKLDFLVVQPVKNETAVIAV